MKFLSSHEQFLLQRVLTTTCTPSDIPSTWMNYRSILSTRDLDRDLSNDSPSAQKDPGLI